MAIFGEFLQVFLLTNMLQRKSILCNHLINILLGTTTKKSLTQNTYYLIMS